MRFRVLKKGFHFKPLHTSVALRDMFFLRRRQFPSVRGDYKFSFQKHIFLIFTEHYCMYVYCIIFFFYINVLIHPYGDYFRWEPKVFFGDKIPRKYIRVLLKRVHFRWQSCQTTLDPTTCMHIYMHTHLYRLSSGLATLHYKQFRRRRAEKTKGNLYRAKVLNGHHNILYTRKIPSTHNKQK